jgi:3-dehydroquinate synthase
LICDPAYFQSLTGPDAVGLGGDVAALGRVVARSVEIKAEIVGRDEKEAGARALLNLGHTFGHALEAQLGFDDAILTHGEAVALGCCLAFRFSVRQGLCAPGEAVRVEGAFAAAGLPTRLKPEWNLAAHALIARMAGDKKAEAGRLTLILARGVGRAFVARDVDPLALGAALRSEGAA